MITGTSGAGSNQSTTSLHNLIVVLIRRALESVCNLETIIVSGRTELVVEEGANPQPDLTVMEWAALEAALNATEYPATDALMVVEVASPSNADDDRKWGWKYKGYAKAKIGVYLLVDPHDKRGPMVSLFNQPNGTRYMSETVVPFGTPITLPEPFPAVIDSAMFPVPVDED